MEISRKELSDIFGLRRLSSGPPITIYYSNIAKSVYATLFHHPKYTNDEVIITVQAFPSMNDYAEKKIAKAIEDFKPLSERRDMKINEILGND